MIGIFKEPFEFVINEGQCRVRFGQARIKFQGSQGCGLRFGEGFLGRKEIPIAKHIVSFGQAGCGKGKRWVYCHRVFEMRHRVGKAGFSKFVQFIAT